MQAHAPKAAPACSEPLAPAGAAALGVPRDSYKEFMDGIYKEFKPPFDRTLGSGVNEKVDESVWRRWLADPGYRSPSLVRALATATVLMSVDDGTARLA